MVSGSSPPFGARLTSCLGPTETDDAPMRGYIRPEQVPHVTLIPIRCRG